MKILVVPNNIKKLDDYINLGINDFMFGVKDFSVHINNNVDFDDLNYIKNKYPNIRIFLAINKTIYNDDIDKLIEILKKITENKVNGVVFYDLAVLDICLENNLDIPLIWNQTHMVTNYNTCNYYYDNGVKYGVLSNEITLNEMIEIASKTKMKLLAQFFGYPVMAHSRRSLLTNYYKVTNEMYNNELTIKERNKEFLVKEEKNGTTFYNHQCLNAIEPFKALDSYLEYGIFSEFNVDHSVFLSVLDNYLNNKPNNMVNNDGFFYTKTIYRVKSDE